MRLTVRESEFDLGQAVLLAIGFELFLALMGAPQSIPNEPFALVGTSLVRTAILVFCSAMLRDSPAKMALPHLGVYAALTWPPQAWAFMLEARVLWPDVLINAFAPVMLAVGAYGLMHFLKSFWWLCPVLLASSIFVPGVFNLTPQLLGASFPIWPTLILLLTLIIWLRRLRFAQ